MKTIKPNTYYLVNLGAKGGDYLNIVRTEKTNQGIMAFRTGSVFGFMLKPEEVLAELDLDVLAAEMVGWDTEEDV